MVKGGRHIDQAPPLASLASLDWLVVYIVLYISS